MQDGIIKGTGNSRYLKSISNFLQQYPTYQNFVAALVAGTLPIDLNGINETGWDQLGTALNKANLLSDETCAALGLPSSAVPDDALSRLASSSFHFKLLNTATIDSAHAEILLDVESLSPNKRYMGQLIANQIEPTTVNLQLSYSDNPGTFSKCGYCLIEKNSNSVGGSNSCSSPMSISDIFARSPNVFFDIFRGIKNNMISVSFEDTQKICFIVPANYSSGEKYFRIALQGSSIGNNIITFNFYEKFWGDAL